MLLLLKKAARRTGAGGLLQDRRRQHEPATTGDRDGMLPPGGKEIDPLPGGAQRRLGGRLDRNRKLWCHVTVGMETEMLDVLRYAQRAIYTRGDPKP